MSDRTTIPSDAQLIRRAGAGDRDAVQALYDRHAGFVFRTAYRFVVDEEDARDITQSVFVSLIQSADRYRPEARLTTWLYRIVVNRCLNHRSQASRRLRKYSRDDGALEQWPAPEEERPDRQLERSEEVGRVHAAMLELPERQRMALILSRFEEMSYQEIAEAMGCSKNSVESLLFRARRQLRRSLGGK
jgi:RNA polymerase sigma-70 factor (ECF subfamily)